MNYSHPIGHCPKMAGALNAGDGGDRGGTVGDGGDAPAENKDKFPGAAIGVPTVPFVPTVPCMVSDGCP
jgi:hypothetical protein